MGREGLNSRIDGWTRFRFKDFSLRAKGTNVNPLHGCIANQVRCNLANSQTCGHAKTAEPRHMKKPGNVGVPSDDWAPIGREGPKAGPAPPYGNIRQSRSML